MRYFFIFLIILYQKYISPYKGFRCAYGCYHKTLSCSAIVKNIIAEHGLLVGWPLIKQQFANCHLAYQTLETEREKRERQKRQRRGNRQPRSCLSKKNQDRCDCVSNFGDCVPDLPCDGFDCSFLWIKPSKNLFTPQA